MDHIDEYLATACQNVKYSEAIRTALALGKKTLNRYYDKTDQSEVYRIAMGKSTPFLSFISNLLQQFSTLVINYITSRMLDGRKPGLTPPETLSVPNLIKHMHLWTFKSRMMILRLIILWCVSFDSSQLDANFPSAFVAFY